MLCDQKQDNFLNVVIGGDETILYDTVMVNTWHNAFVRTSRTSAQKVNLMYTNEK